MYCNVMYHSLHVKLPPYVIFKRKTVLNITSPGIVIRVNEKGWMDNSLVVDWIKECGVIEIDL